MIHRHLINGSGFWQEPDQGYIYCALIKIKGNLLPARYKVLKSEQI